MQIVQIFGVKGSGATRAAERFYKERRIPMQIVDLNNKPMAPGEIKHFTDKFTLPGLLDREGKSYEDAGLKHLKVSDAYLIQKIERDPKLLRLPLVRAAGKLTIGRDERNWKDIAAAISSKR